MRRLVFLIIGAFIVNVYLHAQTTEPTYLKDTEVTYLHPTPTFQQPIGLDPYRHRSMVHTFRYNGGTCFLWLHDNVTGAIYWYRIYANNPTQLEGPFTMTYDEDGTVRQFRTSKGDYEKYTDETSGLYLGYRNKDAICPGLATDSNNHLVFAATRAEGNWDGAKKTAPGIHPVSEISVYDDNGSWIWSLCLTPEQIKAIYETAGAPMTYAAYGNLDGVGSGYVVWTGRYGKDAKATFKLVKLNITGKNLDTSKGNGDGIEYFDLSSLTTHNNNGHNFIKPISDHEIIYEARSSAFGLYDFNQKKFTDKFSSIPSGFGTEAISQGRGFSTATLGMCDFKIGKSGKEHEIYFFPTGKTYSEQFTGFDMTNMTSLGSEGCYYYDKVSPRGDETVSFDGASYYNYLLYMPMPNNTSAETNPYGHIIQYRVVTDGVYNGDAGTSLSGNTVRCYKIEVLPREQIFKAPATGVTQGTEVVKTSGHVTGLNGKADMKEIGTPSYAATVSDYRASVYEHNGSGYGTTPLQTKVNASANDFTFTDLRQPKPAADAGYVIDESQAAKGKYKVTGHVHYKWYGQVSFKSPDFTEYIQPDYNSGSAVPVNYMNIWVKGRPYDGGQNVNPSMIYVPIDFNKPSSPNPVSFYRVWAIKDGHRLEQVGGDIPAGFTKRNVNEFEHIIGENMPDYSGGGQSINFPFVCYYTIPCEKQSEAKAVASHYSYEIETIYGQNKPKVMRTYTASPEEVSGGIVTGVETIDDNSEFSVTPTFVDNVVNVTANEEISVIDIYSLSGSLVKHFEGNGTSFESLNVEDLCAGVYFIKVNDNNIVKIVKR